MSILIKGAEMPRHCGYCFFNDFNICQIEHFTVADAVYHEERHEGCPLVEIPPHGRLIDADKLDKTFIYAEDDNITGMGYVGEEQEIYNEAIDDVRLTVKDAPTVIESEEQEHER